MNSFLYRACLFVLTLSGVFVGCWAYFAPLNWYNTFPGMGLRWLPVLGPYNEHLVKDVGSMYLALTVLSALTLVYLSNRTLRIVTAVSWTTFNLLHLIYHLTMLHMYGTRDAILNVIALGGVLLCSMALGLPARPNRPK
ncbi:hypothetical protein [Mycobacterium montefiorense]|uniref:hypothetical protein n=2 Tax=Mycobacterium montefiorense TaxID=154654 RepID=UPI0021F2BCAE|nr:hypothetical protein [Mycobacterium montefiorense]MCV7425541.1 hypothetical protein [Mycobacterium montefiorense]